MHSRRYLWLVLALLLPGTPARAEIYKYYDAEGNLVLSDSVPRQNPEKAEKIRPRPVMTIPALPPDRRPRPQPSAQKAPVKPQPGEYVIVVQSPVADETYLRGPEPVPVAVSVSPGLAAGHRLEMVLDGAPPVAELTQLVPEGMDRGSHTLEVRVVDAAGKTLKSAAVTFHVQQRSQLAPNAVRNRPKSAK
ncbi:MAG TPA: DUF4124 domain-containing protein [Moraxellaceae bacterium]|nr:DUF4124 domain-containing protein [Moraxellaceae bacterium]